MALIFFFLKKSAPLDLQSNGCEIVCCENSPWHTIFRDREPYFNIYKFHILHVPNIADAMWRNWFINFTINKCFYKCIKKKNGESVPFGINWNYNAEKNTTYKKDTLGGICVYSLLNPRLILSI